MSNLKAIVLAVLFTILGITAGFYASKFRTAQQYAVVSIHDLSGGKEWTEIEDIFVKGTDGVYRSSFRNRYYSLPAESTPDTTFIVVVRKIGDADSGDIYIDLPEDEWLRVCKDSELTIKYTERVWKHSTQCTAKSDLQ